MNSFEGLLPNEGQRDSGRLSNPQEAQEPEGLREHVDEAVRAAGKPFARLAEEVDDMAGDRKSRRIAVSHVAVPALAVAVLAGVGVVYKAATPFVGQERAAAAAALAAGVIAATAKVVKARLRKPYTTPQEDRIARGETQSDAEPNA